METLLFKNTYYTLFGGTVLFFLSQLLGNHMPGMFGDSELIRFVVMALAAVTLVFAFLSLPVLLVSAVKLVRGKYDHISNTLLPLVISLVGIGIVVWGYINVTAQTIGPVPEVSDDIPIGPNDIEINYQNL